MHFSFSMMEKKKKIPRWLVVSLLFYGVLFVLRSIKGERKKVRGNIENRKCDRVVDI